MSSERDIKRRLRRGGDVEPPSDLLQAIKNDIPEELFGPPAVQSERSRNARRRGALRLATAAAVLVGVGWVAVAVFRQGLPVDVAVPAAEVALQEEVFEDSEALPQTVAVEAGRAESDVDGLAGAASDSSERRDAAEPAPIAAFRELPEDEPVEADEDDLRQDLARAERSLDAQARLRSQPSAPAPVTAEEVALRDQVPAASGNELKKEVSLVEAGGARDDRASTVAEPESRAAPKRQRAVGAMAMKVAPAESSADPSADGLDVELLLAPDGLRVLAGIAAGARLEVRTTSGEWVLAGLSDGAAMDVLVESSVVGRLEAGNLVTLRIVGPEAGRVVEIARVVGAAED